jgi:hypothetical protein
MGLATHLGPVLTGTVKNTNGAFPTTAGQVRNTGAGDAYQFGTLPYTTTSTTAPLTFTAPGTGATQIMVLPAGSYIDNINVDVLTAFNAGTNNTLTITLSPTYGTAGTTIFTIAAAGANITTGRYTLGSANTTGSNFVYWTNVSNGQTTATDQFVFAYFTGTGGAATTGSAYICVDYCVRNPDTSYFPQSPQATLAAIPTVPY